MKRFIVGALLALTPVLAHEGEAVETHSAFRVFWDSAIVPNATIITAVIVVIAGIFFWWTLKHGEKQ